MKRMKLIIPITTKKKINEELPKNKSQKEIFNAGEKIRTKLMDRINRGRARSSDNKKKNDLKSNDILMKAKLLEKVLGNIKTPEIMENNYISNNTKNKNIIINTSQNNESNNYIEDNKPVITIKKKKRNISPFEE